MDVYDIWGYLVEYGVATDKEIELVVSINGLTEETMNDIIFVRTGFNNIEQLQNDIEAGGY